MKTLRNIAIAAAFVGTVGVAYSQAMTTDELKSKGATVVAKDDLAALLKGANVRYERAQGPRQITLNADGSFVGSQHKTRGGRERSTVTGNWRITDDSRWCGTTVVKGYGENYCRTVWKLGDKYYFSGETEPGLARELNISK
ncbi:MAG: hypothetical protein HYU76_00955 [Betaproteobacteria bacterium]|nr:hypothetical protein [Betaproteobacteria bacterium]